MEKFSDHLLRKFRHFFPLRVVFEFDDSGLDGSRQVGLAAGAGLAEVPATVLATVSCRFVWYHYFITFHYCLFKT